MTQALSHLRICDFTGQLAGAGATRFLAAFGAQVIRIEDPVNQGRWDILRGMPPYVDERRGVEFGGPFNNHNVEKLGITLNLQVTERGKALLPASSSRCRTSSPRTSPPASCSGSGFGYEALKRRSSEDIIYVSNCGFGHSGPYARLQERGAQSCRPFRAASPSPPACGVSPLRAGATPTWITPAPTTWRSRC